MNASVKAKLQAIAKQMRGKTEAQIEAALLKSKVAEELEERPGGAKLLAAYIKHLGEEQGGKAQKAGGSNDSAVAPQSKQPKVARRRAGPTVSALPPTRRGEPGQNGE